VTLSVARPQPDHLSNINVSLSCYLPSSSAIWTLAWGQSIGGRELLGFDCSETEYLQRSKPGSWGSKRSENKQARHEADGGAAQLLPGRQRHQLASTHQPGHGCGAKPID
jgi:hypothetical protein